MANPCQACGACCAFYRVPVAKSEMEDQAGGTVPVDLTAGCGGGKYLMKGTSGFRKRCIALTGIIGVQVACSIYERRPSTCRRFLSSFDPSVEGNSFCDKARSAFGLFPLGDQYSLGF